jgi:hypothetical protein
MVLLVERGRAFDGRSADTAGQLLAQKAPVSKHLDPQSDTPDLRDTTAGPGYIRQSAAALDARNIVAAVLADCDVASKRRDLKAAVWPDASSLTAPAHPPA